jgi:phosphoribosylaminoimidazolecarboxamide formyltransferase/IMP cyclohydrolase
MESWRKNALLSVYDKENILEFAGALRLLDYTLYASGGTARTITEVGIAVIDIATIVGKPILGHRVVSLSPEVHAGLLAQNTPEDFAELQRENIPWFELLYCNFYPLEAETKKPGATIASVIEKTDIGGPTMVRSAVKGRRMVLTTQGDCTEALRRIRMETTDDPLYREMLASKAERLVADYCHTSADFIEAHLFKALRN